MTHVIRNSEYTLACLGNGTHNCIAFKGGGREAFQRCFNLKQLYSVRVHYSGSKGLQVKEMPRH